MVIGRIAAVALTVGALVTGSAGTSAAAPVLPPPSGEYPVGATALHLVDAARPDPFRPERVRELMVSVFYPAAEVARYPAAHYASAELVPALEQQFGMELPGLLTNSHTGAPARAGGKYPVVLYSPGAGVSRLLGTGLAEDLASRGYVVITVDHTYEAPAVEFPGGRLEPFVPMPDNAFTPEVRQKYLAARLLDIRLVLDSLGRWAGGANPDAGQRELPVGLGKALDVDRVGMVGHSSGGYLAVESMHDDRRIDAAVDLDGQIGVDEAFGRSVTDGTDRPVLVMTSQQIDEVGDAKPSLDAFWQRSTGWKRQLTLRDSAHYDFTDMPLLVPEVARTAAARYIGPIAAGRAADLVNTYVAAMFDKFLRDRPDTVLDRPGTDPEIVTNR